MRFSRAPHEDDRIDLDPLLTDLFRHFGSNEALGFYLDAIRRSPDDIPDELVEALLPLGDRVVAPLIELYGELGEEQGADLAFVLAGLRVRDPRVYELLIDRLEYDAADGAFLLGLYGDQAAREPLQKMLAEIPAEDIELRREITHAIEALDAPEPVYDPEPFDIVGAYPEKELPAFDLLPEPERIEMLRSDDASVRAGAAYSFFNAALSAKAREALLKAAEGDTEAAVRGQAWAALSDAAVEDAPIRDALTAVLNDASKPVAERGGAAVGLHLVANRKEVQSGIEALYEVDGGRAKALEAMWRSLYEPYAKFFASNLDSQDPEIVRQALRGAGYFELTKQAEKIASFFDREEPFDDLREDALFAYALAMPGETTRGRVRGMVRKIDGLAGLSPLETELVEFALDERLRLHNLEPVFSVEEDEEEGEGVPEPPAAPAKVGRNDPCPCGSGKKHKKCCGA